MISDLRGDVATAIAFLLGSSADVLDESVPDFERENLRKATVLLGPATTAKERISRSHVDDQATLTIGVLYPLVQGSDEATGKLADNVLDEIARELFKQKRVGGVTNASCLTYTSETTQDADTWRNVRQAQSVIQMTFGDFY